MIFKIVTIVALFLIATLLIATGVTGFCVSYSRGPQRGFMLVEHQKLARFTWWVNLLAVLFIEGWIRIMGNFPQVDRQLFWTHLAFVLPYFASLTTLRFWLTGMRYPKAHSLVAIYICGVSFALTAATGAMIIQQL